MNINRAHSLLVIGLLLLSPWVNAVCNSKMINPITDVAWNCIFPIRIGGVAVGGSGPTHDPCESSGPICICRDGQIPRIGIKVSFWEPSRIIDTVADPYCIMPFGKTINTPPKGNLRGGLTNDPNGAGKAFQQMHYYIYPVWKILELFTDLPCLEDASFDVAMLTELLPNWNNDALSAVLNPEAVLFGNPLLGMACAADSMSALLGSPRNELFWCMGSWGNAYPLSGSITSTDYVAANAGIAARSIYMMGRLMMLRDSLPDGCGFTPSPIWRKNRYRLQLMRPVRDSTCLPIGKSGLTWSQMKHPPRSGDNFSWMFFKKNDCCVSYH